MYSTEYRNLGHHSSQLSVNRCSPNFHSSSLRKRIKVRNLGFCLSILSNLVIYFPHMLGWCNKYYKTTAIPRRLLSSLIIYNSWWCPTCLFVLMWATQPHWPATGLSLLLVTGRPPLSDLCHPSPGSPPFTCSLLTICGFCIIMWGWPHNLCR